MQREKKSSIVQWKFLIFVDLAIKFQCLQLTNVQGSVAEINFCFNSSLEGFRLNVTILEERNVSSMFHCIMECVNEACCRSVNYKQSSVPDELSECEMLHYLVENISSVLEENSSYVHVYLIQPYKIYNASCLPEKIIREGSKIKTYVSCKEALEKDSSQIDGVYNLQLNENTEIYQAYCHMSSLSSTDCQGGGWTLVMKLDNDKDTFKFSSPLWANNETLNVDSGFNGLIEIESKFASYNNTPFTKLCLGMKHDDVTNWIGLQYSANSLYSVIADGGYRETHAGRTKWKSLLSSSSLQDNCNREGFNAGTPGFSSKTTYVRLGLITNNENHCNSPNTLLGFGIECSGCPPNNKAVYRWSSGNIAMCNSADNGKKTVSTFGYIFVQ